MTTAFLTGMAHGAGIAAVAAVVVCAAYSALVVERPGAGYRGDLGI